MIPMITILGPTATGKTKLAANLAATVQGEVISADSRQVYKGMNLGTGKDLNDYVVNGICIPYHLIDIVNPGYEYNVFEFQQDFVSALNKVTERGKKSILCGGSGLYIDAVLLAYDLRSVPEDHSLREELEKYDDQELGLRLKKYGKLHNTTDLTERKRTIRAIEIAEFQKKRSSLHRELSSINSKNFGLKFERSAIRNRITQRLMDRLKEGLVSEVEILLHEGLKPEQLIFYGLEYKYVTLYITGELSYKTMVEKLNTAIHQFAKRQMTWFRRMEKKGIAIDWIDGNLSIENKIEYIQSKL